jgi:hypothetical protein
MTILCFLGFHKWGFDFSSDQVRCLICQRPLVVTDHTQDMLDTIEKLG